MHGLCGCHDFGALIGLGVVIAISKIYSMMRCQY